MMTVWQEEVDSLRRVNHPPRLRRSAPGFPLPLATLNRLKTVLYLFWGEIILFYIYSLVGFYNCIILQYDSVLLTMDLKYNDLSHKFFFLCVAPLPIQI